MEPWEWAGFWAQLTPKHYQTWAMLKKTFLQQKGFFNIAQVWQRSLKATIGPIVACHQATALDLCMASCFGSSTEDFLSVILISRDGRNP